MFFFLFCFVFLTTIESTVSILEARFWPREYFFCSPHGSSGSIFINSLFYSCSICSFVVWQAKSLLTSLKNSKTYFCIQETFSISWKRAVNLQLSILFLQSHFALFISVFFYRWFYILTWNLIHDDHIFIKFGLFKCIVCIYFCDGPTNTFYYKIQMFSIERQKLFLFHCRMSFFFEFKSVQQTFAHFL